jgi:hypothetical protein
MATINKILIGNDNEVIELTGDALTAFEVQQKKDITEAKAIKSEADAIIAARKSALAKLAALGLTSDEIASL